MSADKPDHVNIDDVVWHAAYQKLGAWAPVNLAADQYAEPTEPPVILGMFYRRKRHALSGPPESAKTLVALAVGLEWVRADLGRFALVDFESGPRPTRLMLEELGATIEEIASVYYVEPDAQPDADQIESLIGAGVTLAIVDAAVGAYDASGLDDNKRNEAEKFRKAWIDPLWKRDVATLLLDHVIKNSENRGKYAIGSERKLGQVDVHLGLEAVTQITRGGHGLIRVTVHKDRPAHLLRPHPCEIHLASDPKTHHVTWDVKPATPITDSAELAPASRKLLEALDAGAGISGQQELVDWIVENYGHGLRRETVSRSLASLAKDGLVACANPDAPVVVSKLWQLTAAGRKALPEQENE